MFSDAFTVGTATLGMRVETVVRLRWLGVLGQLFALLIVLAFAMTVKIWLCLTLVALSAVLNMVLDTRAEPGKRLAPHEAALVLAFDIVQLGALLGLTGGLANPFSVMLLAPALVGVVNLTARLAIGLSVLAAIVMTAIALFHYPLPWFEGEAIALPRLYLDGIWAALVLSLAFIGLYAYRVAHEARLLADALAATELVLQREGHLTALDGLAAAAAHELGTPLATIALVSGELQREHGSEGALGEDIALIRTQTQRCREILGRLSNLGEDPQGMTRQMSLLDLLEEVSAPHRDFDIELTASGKGEGPVPLMQRNPAILYGLGNLIENAVDYAAGKVAVEAAWTTDLVSVCVRDDGPGFGADILARLGEPYVTTRANRLQSAEPDGNGGLGLGFFIAKTFIERSGGHLVVANRRAPERGANVTITWPRPVFEAATRKP